MKAPNQTISLTAYARMRGVAPVSIWQAVREGRIRTIGGRIDPAEADATWYRRHLQREDGQRSGAEAEARREQALLTRTVAQVQITRRKVEQLRVRLTDRDKGQAAIGGLIAELNTALPPLGTESPLAGELVAAIIADLGDLQAEALKVTQRE